MYLAPATRILFALLLVIAILMAAMVVIAALKSPVEASAIVAFVIILIPSATCGTMYLRYVFSEASRKRYQPDILKEHIGIEQVAEIKGVQWALLPTPENVKIPSWGIVNVFLQNAHGKERKVRVIPTKWPVEMPPSDTLAISLRGGEAGILKIPVFFSREFTGSGHFQVRIEVAIPEGVGCRVIQRTGIPPRRIWQLRNVEFGISESHLGPPAHEYVRTWAGFSSLYLTGRERPDLEPLRLLGELTAPL